VILWYAAGAAFVVWNVFQSPGLDFRAVAAGALLPVALDAPLARQAFAHSLLLPSVLLALVMLATAGHGRRLLRRRLLGVPIGWLCGVLLSGAWSTREVFWWPLAGDLPEVALLPSAPVVVVEEALGLAAAAWAWVRFGLADPRRRRRFLRTGRLEVPA
jgi:hypothetical protein